MMRQDDDKQLYILFITGLVFVIWFSLLVAPYGSGGIIGILMNSQQIIDNPFQLVLTEDSVKTLLVCLGIYALGVGMYLSMKRNYRKGVEHGSAKWGKPETISRKYQCNKYEDNKLLTQNVRIGFDGIRHRRNLNVLVVGGSGSGKTRHYVKPNAMQTNTSFVILDPKGEILRDTGRLFVENGFNFRILDLINMERSHCYNPFIYLPSDNDAQRLVTNLLKATTPKGAQTQDPFWDTAASMLLLALIFYLKYEAPGEEQNFEMVLELLRAGEVKEEDEGYISILDELFMRLEMDNPDHIALKYYRNYHTGSAKTLKSVQITLAARLEKFNLESLAALSRTDELELGLLGKEKVAIFALIPDNDTSFNFLVSILYTQLFQQLFYTADREYGGSLPAHVHFLMDEFANVSLPDDFDKILSVMRSRNISVSIILQNLAQLKALFEKQWESIVGNCDEFLYLGGNEASTHRFVSDLMGKETIDMNSYNKTYGMRGNYVTNYQILGRELLTPDEVRMLADEYALLFIRGEKPVIDFKYDLTKHPDADRTPDGSAGASEFKHGAAPDGLLTLSLTEDGTTETISITDISCELPIIDYLFDTIIDKSVKNDIANSGTTLTTNMKNPRVYKKQCTFVFICMPPENNLTGSRNKTAKRYAETFPRTANKTNSIASFIASFLISSKA